MPKPLVESRVLTPGTFLIEKVKNDPGVLMRIGPIPVSEAGVENANKRIYDDELWESVVTCEGTKKRVNERKMLGELDHPETDRGTKLDRVSHVITFMKKEGNRVLQTFEVLNTPMGKIAEALFDARIPVGVSTRGYGDTEVGQDGKDHVKAESYVYDTTDFVADPSAKLFAQMESTQRGSIRRAITESIELDKEGRFRDYQKSLLSLLDEADRSASAPAAPKSGEEPPAPPVPDEKLESQLAKAMLVIERLRDMVLAGKAITEEQDGKLKTITQAAEAAQMQITTLRESVSDLKLQIECKQAELDGNKRVIETLNNEAKALEERAAKAEAALKEQTEKISALESAKLSESRVNPGTEPSGAGAALPNASTVKTLLDGLNAANQSKDAPMIEGVKVDANHPAVKRIGRFMKRL